MTGFMEELPELPEARFGHACAPDGEVRVKSLMFAIILLSLVLKTNNQILISQNPFSAITAYCKKTHFFFDFFYQN